MIAAGTRLLSWTLCQRCCVGDPPSQVPRSQCTSSLVTISGFIVAQRSRCARPCAVSMARRSWWRSRSIGECLEPHSPLPVPYRGRAVGVIYRVPPLPPQVAGAALRPLLLKLQTRLPGRPAAAELESDAVDIVAQWRVFRARARTLVSLVTDRFGAPVRLVL